MPPPICAAMNTGAEDGAMPANVSENMRPTVIAGLAKLVERREPVRGADVGADGGRRDVAAAGPGEGEDDQEQPGGRDHLRQQCAPLTPGA